MTKFTALALLLLTTISTVTAQSSRLPGDRIVAGNITGIQDKTAVAMPVGEDYQLAPGDVLNIVIEGKANLHYKVNPGSSETDSNGKTGPNEVIINPSGTIVLPIAGQIEAAGKTISQLQEDVHKALSEYFKSFQVLVTLSRPRTMKVFVNGVVTNPGAQSVTGTTTVIETLLAAGIEPNGSTRRVEVRRNGSSITVDLYSIIIQGQLDKNLVLESGDVIYVPPVTQWVDISGEIGRPGRYELLPGMKLSDLIKLAQGTTPAAVQTKLTIERMTGQDTVQIISANAEKACSDPACSDNITLVNGDKLRVPSLAEYMPMVRMVGEFVGRGVFQRAIGGEEEQVLNKSGVYLLAEGKTAGQLIRETGGVTPQADLKVARIRRADGDRVKEIPLDLERLLMQNDKSADVVLQSGDTIVLPALADKVHVFGAITKPGSYAYTPNRKLLDYVGDAQGPTPNGRLSHVRVIRGDLKNPVILNCDLTKGVKGSVKDNPILEPGDVVFVMDRSFNGWRDAVSILTTFRLLQTMTE